MFDGGRCALCSWGYYTPCIMSTTKYTCDIQARRTAEEATTDCVRKERLAGAIIAHWSLDS